MGEKSALTSRTYTKSYLKKNPQWSFRTSAPQAQNSPKWPTTLNDWEKLGYDTAKGNDSRKSFLFDSDGLTEALKIPGNVRNMQFRDYIEKHFRSCVEEKNAIKAFAGGDENSKTYVDAKEAWITGYIKRMIEFADERKI